MSTEKYPPQLEGTFVQSEAYATGPFAPHGSMQIHQLGAVFKAQATGPFNVEFMKAYGRMWASLLKSYTGGGRLVFVSFWHTSMLASPDALQVYDQILQIGARNIPEGSVHIWHVPEDIEGRSMMLPRWREVLVRNQQTVQVCADEAEVQALILRALGQTG